MWDAYVAVLADLRLRRDELTVAIIAVERIASEGAGRAAGQQLGEKGALVGEVTPILGEEEGCEPASDESPFAHIDQLVQESKQRGGLRCPRCGHGYRHKVHQAQCKGVESATHNGLAKGCGHHPRSRVHVEECLGKEYVNPRDINTTAKRIVEGATNGVRRPVLVDETPRETDGECIHHWKIDSPDGGTSGATCRKCFSRRDYQNGEPFKLPTKGTPWRGVKEEAPA